MRKEITEVAAMIECPQGYNHQLSYNQKEERFTLDRILLEGMVYPFDFGFITDTITEHRIGSKIVLIADSGSYPGCLVKCRIVGSMQAEVVECDGRNVYYERLIGVPVSAAKFAGINHIGQLSGHYLERLDDFFRSYNTMAAEPCKVMEMRSTPAGGNLLTA
ncbi:MAG: inorganic diphosphatase [Mucilaginibacter sp.]|uniref:inorganic diphosphatase n=1 Tax=Mucilaginibacter sp. TaxID=1882438 RepID=UPI0031B1F74D